MAIGLTTPLFDLGPIWQSRLFTHKSTQSWKSCVAARDRSFAVSTQSCTSQAPTSSIPMTHGSRRSSRNPQALVRGVNRS